MSDDYRVYVLFPNHTEGLRLSSELRKRQIKSTIAPTPRSLNMSCSISLIVNEEDLALIKGLIANLGIRIEKIAKVPVDKNWKYRGS